MRDLSYVRTEMLAEQDPPVTASGPIGWVRENLFNGWFNSILTVISLAFIYWIVTTSLSWIWSPTWNGSSLSNCREIISEAGKHHGACWGVVNERWPQMLFGFYPIEERIRPTIAFFWLFVRIFPQYR